MAPNTNAGITAINQFDVKIYVFKIKKLTPEYNKTTDKIAAS
jgi:hypothetical protein